MVFWKRESNRVRGQERIWKETDRKMMLERGYIGEGILSWGEYKVEWYDTSM